MERVVRERRDFPSQTPNARAELLLLSHLGSVPGHEPPTL